MPCRQFSSLENTVNIFQESFEFLCLSCSVDHVSAQLVYSNCVVCRLWSVMWIFCCRCNCRQWCKLKQWKWCWHSPERSLC